MSSGPVSVLSLQIHETIKTIRHIFTLFALLFSVPALIAIILCSIRISKRYSTLLAFIVIVGVVGDIVVQLVWDPLMLLPAPCFIRENPIIPIPGGPSLYYEIWVGVMLQNVPILTLLFLAVQPPRSRYTITPNARNIIFITFACLAVGMAVFLKMAEMAGETEHILLNAIEDKWPTIPTSQAKCFDRFVFVTFAVTCVFGLIFCATYMSLISWHTFTTIKKTLTMSDTTKKFHKIMTRGLLIQVTIPLLLLGFPLIAFWIAVLTHVEGPLPFSICFLFISNHSPVHSIILIATTPIYRKRLADILVNMTKSTFATEVSVNTTGLRLEPLSR